MLPSGPASSFKLGFVVLAGFTFAAIVVSLPLIWTDSPVVQRHDLRGQIVGARPSPMNPTGIVRTGLEIDYVVELPDGLRVRIRDSKAYRVGSWLTIERATRENGSQIYAFGRPADP